MEQSGNLSLSVYGTSQRWCFIRIVGLLILLACWFAACPSSAQTATNKQAQIAALNSEMNEAIQRVRNIVNQPVPQLRRNSEMRVSTYSPGWFHDGANKPDFNSVDIRTTQEKTYDAHEYVTSDLTPGVVFHGRDLEFNANTKYFYTDRTLPKKKLTEPEMVEINRLYRIIGHCEQALSRLQTPEPSADIPLAQNPQSTSGSLFKFIADHRLIVALLSVAAILMFRK